uniref:C-type lectin domain-containing protein n=1 Tax=Steinernema glaseri TaxID=37863 RepID=A0A1I7ZPZ1_9BILA
MDGSRMQRFLLAMALVCPLSALRVRYTLIAQDIIASEVDKGPVNSKSECMLLAYNVSSLAYVLVVKDGITRCNIPMHLDEFKEKTDSSRNVFFVDTREPSDVCEDPFNVDGSVLFIGSEFWLTVSVRSFFNGSCDAPPEFCETIKRLHEYCKKQADNTFCIREDLYSGATTPLQITDGTDSSLQDNYGTTVKEESNEEAETEDAGPSPTLMSNLSQVTQPFSLAPNGSQTTNEVASTGAFPISANLQTTEASFLGTSDAVTRVRIANATDSSLQDNSDKYGSTVKGESNEEAKAGPPPTLMSNSSQVSQPFSLAPNGSETTNKVASTGAFPISAKQETTEASLLGISDAGGTMQASSIDESENADGAKDTQNTDKLKATEETTSELPSNGQRPMQNTVNNPGVTSISTNAVPNEIGSDPQLGSTQSPTYTEEAETTQKFPKTQEATTASVCPDGQKRLQGKEDCCKFITHKDGREECCEHIWNDQDGVEYCCPENKPCCGEMTGQNSFCCPKGKENGNKGGGAVCCPIGTLYQTTYGQQTVCCPNSYDAEKGTPFCCPVGFRYLKSFGKCVGAFDINPSQMKKLCTDLNSLPVKIENKQQNDDLNSLDKWDEALIGLHIPEGQTWEKNGFRWLSDGSGPNYTNWGGGEPNNIFEPEIFVRTHKAGRFWFTINNTNMWVPNYIICMADAYLGVDEQP